MTTPKFILHLREKIGHDLLWLTGITGVVLDDEERILLARRRDTGRWSLPAGILEPGEQPAPGLLREIEEETGVEAEIVRLLSIETLPPSCYPNGDQVQFLDLTFHCHAVRGEARVNDDENLEVAWFPLDDLPPLPEHSLAVIAQAKTAGDQPHFIR
ncbi:NUDIX hydrolase [Kribbella sp. CA-293567]|uniref:NUDIX hydrolase n=1 Tax=Kribbella sp. CA-293567 TaxID=3002436 RepID=UPI0022DE1D1A|nr:NUDIX domain-containing protein [Kribbella sp. CA-293567]WBQ02390.1 NUDIX domain-containing protein [Kribbella sp. CA-293567]